jgi:nucleoside-diphosphate-sugar epimerase
MSDTTGSGNAVAMAAEQDLTVAITGPTGTFGSALLPLLESDERVKRVIGVARRPFDPAEQGWTKMEYRRGDVRDAEVLKEAFAGVDVVVHLAFAIFGGDTPQGRETNYQGTRNTFQAAAAAGARRFVYASSIAAYGFHRDNPVGMKETWPTRPAHRLVYAREKAELEEVLATEAANTPDLGLYVLRPPAVLGPHAVGGKELLSGRLAPIGQRLQELMLRRSPIPLPVVVPDIPLQIIHEHDVATALQLCVVGAGSPGAYNIAPEQFLTLGEVAREVGLIPISVSSRPWYAMSRRLVGSRLPVGWLETLSHPAVMDTRKARTELGWSAKYTAREAIRATLNS